jgi:hypothetical protein
MDVSSLSLVKSAGLPDSMRQSLGGYSFARSRKSRACDRIENAIA